MITRLVPAAIAAWGASAAVLLGSGLAVEPGDRRQLALLILVAGVIFGLAALVLLRHLARWAVPMLVAAMATSASAVFVLSLAAEPVSDAAARRQAVTMTVTITGDLRVRDGAVQGVLRGEDRLSARAQAQSVEVEGQRWDVDVPVRLDLPRELEPAIGSVLLLHGRLSPESPARGVAASLRADSWELLAPADGVMAAAQAVRSGLRHALEGSDARAASLVAGLAVGDEMRQPAGLADEMRVSGLSHLTAVSGGNTSLVMGGVLLLAALLGLSVRWRAALALASLLGYVVIVGPQPSVLRAAAMGALTIVALLMGTARRGIAALAAIVILLVVLNPALATSWGFALSVSATGGLLVLAPVVVRRIVGEATGRAAVVRQGLAQALAMTVAAQIATAPVIAAFGNGLSVVSIPANLVVEPVVAPVTVLGLLAALVSPVAPAVAELLAHLAVPFAAWIAAVAAWSSGLPIATLPWPGGFGGALAAALAAAAVIQWLRRPRGRHERRWTPVASLLSVLVLAVVATVALRLPDRAGWPPPDWRLVACDVGQGDGIVLRVDQDSAVVIDAGPDPRSIDRCLTDLGVSRVALLILTHAHADHVEGVPGVLQGRPVERAIVSPLREPIEESNRVDGWLRAVPMQVAAPGMQWQSADVHLEILWPQRIIRGSGSMPNNASVVVLAQTGDVSVLLLGDVETAAQVALRSSLTVGGVDVVKVAHHGSRLQDPALPAWTGGQVALISVGAGNDYGHPAPETLAAWAAVGAVIGRTDTGGDIAVTDEGDGALQVVTRRSD